MKRNPVLVVLWKNKVGMCSRSSAIRGIFTAAGSIGIGKPSSFVLALSLLFWNCANHGERAIPPSGQALCRHWSKFLASVKIILIMGYTNSCQVRSRVLSTIRRYHHPIFMCQDTEALWGSMMCPRTHFQSTFSAKLWCVRLWPDLNGSRHTGWSEHITFSGCLFLGHLRFSISPFKY